MLLDYDNPMRVIYAPFKPHINVWVLQSRKVEAERREGGNWLCRGRVVLEKEVRKVFR